MHTVFINEFMPEKTNQNIKFSNLEQVHLQNTMFYIKLTQLEENGSRTLLLEYYSEKIMS